MNRPIKTKNVVQVTAKLIESDYEALKKLAFSLNIPMAELIREFIAKGMHIEKTKEDIDFIRKNIREELECVMHPHNDSMKKLLIRVGVMATSMCYFTSKIIYNYVKFPNKQEYEDLFNDSKREVAAFLSSRDETLDYAFSRLEKQTKK